MKKTRQVAAPEIGGLRRAAGRRRQHRRPASRALSRCWVCSRPKPAWWRVTSFRMPKICHGIHPAGQEDRGAFAPARFRLLRRQAVDPQAPADPDTTPATPPATGGVTDPFSFGPVLGPMDDYYIARGPRTLRLFDKLGAHADRVSRASPACISRCGRPMPSASAWSAPFNEWDGRRNPMRVRHQYRRVGSVHP